jgi:ribonuclease D
MLRWESATWVVHSASGDLPGLAEVGLVPQRLFDTELAARLLGWPRVGLSAVVARVFGYGLAKEHSAVDWSTRPLPEDWLRYAALDVDLLLELHEYLAAELAEQGKTEWAEQEFEHLRTMEAADRCGAVAANFRGAHGQGSAWTGGRASALAVP